MTSSTRSFRAEVEAVDPDRLAQSINPDVYEFTNRTFKRRESYGSYPLHWEDWTPQTWNGADGFQYWRTLGS